MYEEKEMRPICVCCVLILAFSLVSCGRSLDLAYIEVGPKNTVSWEDAKTIIEKGDVDYVAQSHALDVTIVMDDGTRYQTKEPEIDAVNDWLKACGKWGKVGYATE